MTNPNKVLLGLLGAAAAGVIVGILLAPDKGGEVRKKIAEKANDFACSIGEMITSGKEKLADAADNLTKKSKDVASDVSSQLEETKSMA